MHFREWRHSCVAIAAGGGGSAGGAWGSEFGSVAPS